MDEKLKKQIILDHYENPINRGLVKDDSYIKINMNSESCIDNLDFMIKIEDNIIKDVRFDGEACAISTSSSSIMINMILNKTIDEVLLIIKNYENMIEEKEYDSELIGEANVFDTIYKQANRKKCALLPYDGLKKAILKYKGEKYEKKN